MERPRELQLRIDRSRWLNRVSRKLKKKEFHKRNSVQRKEPASNRYLSSILTAFCPDVVGTKRDGDRAPKRFTLPRIFSLTENPQESLRVVREIVRYSRSAKRPRLVLDHRQIRRLGLGAEALLAVVLKEISLEAEFLPGSYIKGYRPTDAKIRVMMDEIGCVRVLGSGVDEDIRVSIKSNASVYRHENRGLRPVSDPLQRDLLSKTSRDFSDHLDSCLARIGKRLTASGREKLTSHIAEVLINAQEHSGTAQWLVTGYLDFADQALTYRTVILSFGNTISQNFENTSPESVPARLVQPYVKIHEKRRLFGRNWTPEELLTVVALQGNVSSQLDDKENQDRGQGTVDLIEFFQNMAAVCGGSSVKPLMSVFSGKTHITFDGSYRMRYEESADRMIIAFNKNNNLLELPDPAAVKRLEDEGFPGVVVSIVVPLAAATVEDLPGGPK